MKESAILLSLCLPAVLSFYRSLGEDPRTSVISPMGSISYGPQPSPQHTVEHQVLDTNESLNKKIRRRRTPRPQSQLQPSSVNTSLASNISYKIVCYYTNYAWYRSGIAKYSPRDIDPQMCTHIVYGYGKLDPDRLVIKPGDNWADIESKLYEKVTALKKKGVKVSIAIGGWEDSSGDKYSRMVNSPTSRRRFIEHLLQFLYQHNFDGLELDWEFPKCWQLDCSKGPESDKEAFASLVRELREAFKPHGLLVSAAVPPTKHPIDAGYNIPVMSENLDWITVKTYDYHGHWDKRTGHGAPLYAKADDDEVTFSVNFTINYWLSQGADRRKLVLGISMFGNSFKLDSAADNGLYAYSSGPGDGGEHTKSPGILTYYEICDRIQKRGWEVVSNTDGTMGPYARHNDQWVSYDDAAMVRRKAEYVMQNNLGGVMIFSLDFDDFRNNCGGGKHTLLRAVNSVLRNSPESEEKQTTPQEITEGQTSQEQTTERQTTDHQMSTAAVLPLSGKVICYFTNWSWYRQGLGKFLPQNIDSSLCTHIVYAFATLEPKSLTVQVQDKWADIDNDFYKQVTQLKQKGLKVMLALGGWDDSKGDKYSRLVSDPDATTRFVQHFSEFLRNNDFDGVSLHWEYPTCWQADCNAGPAADKEGFSALVTELSQELKPRGLLMSAIVSRNNMVIERAYDVKTLIDHVDWLELKSYDYRGHWDRKTGHGSPLYYTEGDISPYMNVNFSVNYWLGVGAPREKLVLGMPLYGQTFTLEDPSRVTLGAPTLGPGNPGPYTGAPGIMAFYEICEMVHGEGWKVEKLESGTVAYHDNQWVSYDDVSDVHRKAQFIKELGLGGAMTWALDFDDFNNNCGCGNYPLLKTLNRGLRDTGTTEQSAAVASNCTSAHT